ncbi:MAG: helicase-related protein [Actinomycetia bacterium]|nr:helicase-related protein [Actinomycetes bacterium]
MGFDIGALVRARGREWVVLPESEDDLLVLRPLGGTDDEITGILTSLETVVPASFELPDPSDVGDHRSCRLLRDALRLSFRSSAGPFRSFGRIAVEPRPYQLVPLLMALRLDPVRLLIADDVGVGKTVEALLVASELLARGEAERLAVLCPPHLAEQWQCELRDKFHLEAELVLPSTAARLERGLGVGESLFDRHDRTVVSTDFIKGDRRRDDFLRRCPELVIVDEAHTCANPDGGRGRHQRHELVTGLAANPGRHLILVTATPHSGKEAPFRALLGFLDPTFAELPEDLPRAERRAGRERLARHMVQRRRGDIQSYLDAETPFPSRETREDTYELSPEQKKYFRRVYNYAREAVADPAGGSAHRRRVRWWSALALLRSIGSSPAAAAATLRNRAQPADTSTAEEADEVGRRALLDLTDEETTEGADVSPGADHDDTDNGGGVTRRRLREFAREAEKLQGAPDAKLQKAVTLITGLVEGGYNPIVFCKFIPTAEYVTDTLRGALPGRVAVEAVTGTLPPGEREQRIHELGQAGQRVLVATDCLSEGINLQQHFDAVVHYDLAWNPTRHEQREGRVDRYGQQSDPVRVLTYYGRDNPIDGIVLNVLLRKSKQIRSQLGVSVPVPVDSNTVLEAILEGLLLQEWPDESVESQLALWEEDLIAAHRDKLHREWDSATEREKLSRTIFAQATIKVEEVARELAETRAAVGSGADVARFTTEALRAHGASVSNGTALTADLRELPRALRDALPLGEAEQLRARFEPHGPEGLIYLSRTHPLVEGLASHVVDTAFDPVSGGKARRAGATRTSAVETRTTLLLARIRHEILTRRRGHPDRQLLAEESQLLAFTGAPGSANWLPSTEAETLLTVGPEGNITHEQATQFLERVIDGIGDLRPHLEQVAGRRAHALQEAHERARKAARLPGQTTVEPKLPVDVLGIYLYLPIPAAS